jgi:uncharacterized coiled-coil protein SlyX
MTDAKNEKNGTWGKVIQCVLLLISLVSVGWAASSTIAWSSYHRMDTQGTEKSRERITGLEIRSSTIENTLNIKLVEIDKKLGNLQDKMDQHLRASVANKKLENGFVQ